MVRRRVTRLCVTAALVNLAFTAGWYGAKIWDSVAADLAAAPGQRPVVPR
jgi:hypothetical protein